MRPMYLLTLVLVAACGDLTGLDLSGIDDWSCCGTGIGGPGGYPSVGAVRAVATTDVVFSAGSEFQLEARDRQGNAIADPAGTFLSNDTLVLAVSAEGWAVARAEGTAELYFVVRDSVRASTAFSVGVPPSDAFLRVEVHGTTMECNPPFNCTPAGSPIIDGWVGQTTDIAGLSLTFHGADGLQATDQVSTRPLSTAACPAEDSCVSVAGPSPAHAWAPGDSTLCLSVTVGDSVAAIGWVSPVNAEWEVTWSRPGLFVVRQPVYLYVRPLLTEPPSAC